MKKVLVCKETLPAETRVALIPDDIKKLSGMGFEFTVVSGAGAKSGFDDAAYEAVGAKIVKSEQEALDDAEIVVRILKPESAKGLKPDTLHVSFLDPFNEKTLLHEFADNKIQAVSLEMIPRTTLAQKMDVQSSQTSLAGYVAVLNAAARMPKILPMMVTPAGTINPARVFVIGVGVAGLQAIATAKRLGAVTYAADIRPAAAEQAKSLGAKIVETGIPAEAAVGAGGYALALSEEMILSEREHLKDVVKDMDIIFCSALVPSKLNTPPNSANRKKKAASNRRRPNRRSPSDQFPLPKRLAFSRLPRRRNRKRFPN